MPSKPLNIVALFDSDGDGEVNDAEVEAARKCTGSARITEPAVLDEKEEEEGDVEEGNEQTMEVTEMNGDEIMADIELLNKD